MALSDFLLNLAGAAEQVELRTAVAARIGVEAALAAGFGGELLTAITSGGKQGLFTDTSNVAGHVLDLVNKSESEIGKLLFENLVTGPMRINANAVAPENRQGIDTIERVLGFAADLSLGTAAVSGALEPLLGSHGLGKMLEFIKGIPDEVGLNYFIGTVMANVFESATGGPLREAILEQSRGSRLEWPQISRLLRMHEISDAEATDRLGKAGFRNTDIGLLTKLDRQLLSVTDLQQLVELGYIGDAEFKDRLATLGFTAVDADLIASLSSHKAAASGEATARATAVRQFRNGTLSESALREFLRQDEMPATAIDHLIAGLKLEQGSTRLHENVSEIKNLWQHQHINTDEARARLQKLGLQDSEIADILLVWGDQKKTARSGIGTARILSYLVGGTIDKQTAYNHLITNGLDQADAQFLVDHPTTHSGVHTKPLSAATVIAAYKDGVLTIDEASAKLDTLNIDPSEKQLLLANAVAIVSRGTKPRHPTKTLTEVIVTDALKYGLASPEWAERELETIGYPSDDAILIVAIELTKLDASWPTANAWTVLT